MKIAFVGKGGSGKSTVSALFTQYIRAQNNPLLVIDADINVHLPHLLDIKEYETYTSHPECLTQIHSFIAGSNTRVHPDHVINTTPPGQGSGLITVSPHDPLLSRIGYVDRNFVFLQVGPPAKNHVGTRCYHVNLESVETLLSHVNDRPGEFVIVDMVAGADAFSTSMYIQFDVLCIIVEPTEESVLVVGDYLKLAKHAGIEHRVQVVANKVEDEADLEFIRSKNIHPIASFRYDKAIRLALREGRVPVLTEHSLVSAQELYSQLNSIEPMDKNERMRGLHELHRFMASKPHNIMMHGNLAEQIDDSFSFGQ